MSPILSFCPPDTAKIKLWTLSTIITMPTRSFISIIFALTLGSCVGFSGRSSTDFSWVNDSIVFGRSSQMALSVNAPIEIRINQASDVDCISLREFADTVETIILETTEESLIGRLEKIMMINDTFYVLDRMKHPGLYLFERNGKFIGRVGARGQGPEQYSEPTDFDVSVDTIYILDQFRSRLHVFDKRRDHAYTKNIPFIATGISVMNDSVMMFNNIDADNHHLGPLIDYSVYITDSDLNIDKYGFKREHGKYNSFWEPTNFYRNGDLTYYHPYLSPDVYTITPDGEAAKSFQVNFGQHALPDEYVFTENRKKLDDAENNDNYYIFNGDFFATTNWEYFAFAKAHWVRHVLADRNGNAKVSTLLLEDLVNNIPVRSIYGTTGDMLIGGFDPSDLIPGFTNATEEQRRKLLTARGYELCQQLSADDNPVLFLITLKGDRRE